MHLSCQMAELCLAPYMDSEHSRQPTIGQKSSNTVHFITRLLNASRDLLSPVLKVKSRMAVSGSVINLVIAWPTRGCGSCPPSIMRGLTSITSPGKDAKSKFNVEFLMNASQLHSIVKLENCKLGTICIMMVDTT